MADADTAAIEAMFLGLTLEAAVSSKADARAAERVLGQIEDLKRAVLRLFQQSSELRSQNQSLCEQNELILQHWELFDRETQDGIERNTAFIERNTRLLDENQRVLQGVLDSASLIQTELQSLS